MPDASTQLAAADNVLMALGVVIVVSWLARSFLRKSWRSDWRIPAPPSNVLTNLELVLAAWAYITFGQLGIVIAKMMMDGDGITVSAPEGGPAVPGPSIVLGGTIGTLGTIVVLILIGRSRFDGGLVSWGLHVRRLWQQVAIAICITIAVLPICYGILAGTQWIMERLLQMSPQEHGAIELLRNRSGPQWALVLTAINAIVFVPVGEELLFRGIVLPALCRWLKSPVAGLILSGVLFGLIHLSVGKSVPALMVFGVILGAAYLKHRSLLLVIMIHALFNGKTILWLFLGGSP